MPLSVCECVYEWVIVPVCTCSESILTLYSPLHSHWLQRTPYINVVHLTFTMMRATGRMLGDQQQSTSEDEG